MSNQKSIMVTDAAGTTGHAAIRELLTGNLKSHFHEVYAGVKDANKVPELKKLGAKVVQLNPNDPNQLVDNFRNIDAVCLVPSNDENNVQQAKTCIESAKRGGVKCLLLMTSMGIEEKKYEQIHKFLEIEENLKKSGISNWAILRTNFYDENFLYWAENMKQTKTISLPLKKDSGFAPISARDVAKCIALILAQESPLQKQGQGQGGAHGGRQENNNENLLGPLRQQTFRLTGPEKITPEKLVEIITKITSIKMNFKEIKREELENILKNSNASQEQIRVWADFFEMAKDNKGNVGTVTEDFKKITNKEAMKLEHFFKDYSEHFRNATQ